MTIVQEALQAAGVCEDRILHRKDGHYGRLANAWKDAHSPEVEAKSPGVTAKIRAGLVKHVRDTEDADAERLDRIENIKSRIRKTDNANRASNMRKRADAAKAKQKADQAAANTADKELQARIAELSGRVVRGNKKSGAPKVPKAARDPDSPIKHRKKGEFFKGYNPDLIAGVDKSPMTKGAQRLQNIPRNFTNDDADNERTNWAGSGSIIGFTDNVGKQVFAKFKHPSGREVYGVKQQVFPASYKGKPGFAGGRFAGDKNPETGKEYNAGDQYIAEAMDIFIEALEQGYTESVAISTAVAYLHEECGYGRWSAKRALDEALDAVLA